MIIEITSSGGIGGLASADLKKRADMSSADEPMRSEISAAFDPTRLSALAKDAAGHPGSADILTYTIVIIDETEKRHQFEFSEDALPPEMLDMIDGM